MPGQGFGELSFVLGGASTDQQTRTASVIAEGDDDMRSLRDVAVNAMAKRRTSIAQRTTGSGEHDEESEDSSQFKPTICLRVSVQQYMQAMRSRGAGGDSKGSGSSGGTNLRHKLGHLQKSCAFRHWGIERLYELAALVTPRTFPAGHIFARRGSMAKEVYLIVSGSVRIFVTMPLPNHNDNVTRSTTVDFALLQGGIGDLFGVCEALDARSASDQARLNRQPTQGTMSMVAAGAWRRNAICETEVKMLVFSMATFQKQVLDTDTRTAELAVRLREARAHWEALRMEHATQLFANESDIAGEKNPPRISRRTMAFAKYQLNSDTVGSTPRRCEGAKANNKALENKARDTRALCWRAREALRVAKLASDLSFSTAPKRDALLASHYDGAQACCLALSAFTAAADGCMQVISMGTQLEAALGDLPLGAAAQRLIDQARRSSATTDIL